MISTLTYGIKCEVLEFFHGLDPVFHLTAFKCSLLLSLRISNLKYQNIRSDLVLLMGCYRQICYARSGESTARRQWPKHIV